MLRVLSRQAAKAVPRPFRLSTGTSRRIHSSQLPYTGPPNYETIARRFSSSQPDPQAYLNRKREQEAKERGEFIDIQHETLETTIAEEMGIPYLSKATEAEAKKVVEVGIGYIYGLKRHTMVPFVVRHREEIRWVFFMVDSGAPMTYLSIQACKVLGIDETAQVTIGGHHHAVQQSPALSHFHDINLIGTDFCHIHRLYKVEDYPKRRAKLYKVERKR